MSDLQVLFLFVITWMVVAYGFYHLDRVLYKHFRISIFPRGYWK